MAHCECDRRNIHPITLEVYLKGPLLFKELCPRWTWEIKLTNWRNVSPGMSGFVFMTSEEFGFTCDQLFTSNKVDSITIKVNSWFHAAVGTVRGAEPVQLAVGLSMVLKYSNQHCFHYLLNPSLVLSNSSVD